MSRPRLPKLPGIGYSTEPTGRRSSRELFTTGFWNLTPDPATTLPSPEANSSPAPQDFASGGEQFGPLNTLATLQPESLITPQTLDRLAFVTIASHHNVTRRVHERARLIHHATQNHGEQFKLAP